MTVMPFAPGWRPQAEVALPDQWQFWMDTTVGHVPLGPVAAHGFSCTMRLSAFGHGQITLPMEPGTLDGQRLTRLWSYRIWCWYGDAVIWCGVPTGIADEGSDYVTLTLTELPGYLGKRQYDVPGGHRYYQTEQTQIARELAAPVEDVGVVISANAGPGFNRDRQYEYLEGGDRGQLLTNLSQVIGGPEFRAQYDMDLQGFPRCTLRIAYPRVGGPTGLVLGVPGTGLGYRAAWDSDQLRTRTFAVGDLPESAPEGAQKPVAVVDRPQADLPRLDAADDWPQTYLISTLNERANQMATSHAAPALDLSVTAGQAIPVVGSYGVGDDVTVRLVTPLLEDGLDAVGRLTELTLSAGEGTATWTVALELPPPAVRTTLTGRLSKLDRSVQGIFRTRLAPV